RETLREATALESEHLSCYEVIYEEDTPLYAQLKAGEFDVDEELACDMYDELIRVAGENGFQQYEIANFARDYSRQSKVQSPRSKVGDAPVLDLGPWTLDIPPLACQHNVNY